MIVTKKVSSPFQVLWKRECGKKERKKKDLDLHLDVQLFWWEEWRRKKTASACSELMIHLPKKTTMSPNQFTSLSKSPLSVCEWLNLLGVSNISESVRTLVTLFGLWSLNNPPIQLYSFFPLSECQAQLLIHFLTPSQWLQFRPFNWIPGEGKLFEGWNGPELEVYLSPDQTVIQFTQRRLHPHPHTTDLQWSTNELGGNKIKLGLNVSLLTNEMFKWDLDTKKEAEEEIRSEEMREKEKEDC